MGSNNTRALRWQRDWGNGEEASVHRAQRGENRSWDGVGEALWATVRTWGFIPSRTRVLSI